MSSLRARLMAAVLITAAVGLILLAAITYVEQRSFQLSRIDDTARSGTGAVLGALAQQGIGEHDDPDRDQHLGGPKNLRLAEVLVDDPPHALAARLGCDRYGPALVPAERRGERWRDAIGLQ